MEENFMRSANPPTTSAGVMMAKVIWKIMKSDSGISPLRVSRPTLAISTLLKSPIQALPSPKARL
jgi:hypothetical protein